MSHPAEPAPPHVPPIPQQPLPSASTPPAELPGVAPPASSPAARGTAGPVVPASGPSPYPPTFTAPYPAPGAYAPPPGYAGPYLASPAVVGGVAPQRATGPRLGLVALLVAIAATVISGIAIVIAAFNIGLGAGREIALRPLDVRFDWSALTPVRDWVLVAEASFWVGTALGLWAIVQGIVAIAKNRGRGLGIAAVVVAALGLIVFVIALQSALTAGLAAGTGIGG